MKYNLIRNAYFRSLTTGGTGNVDLTWTQLESLMDQNLTSSGVTLTTSGILYLETDLSQRIKVDDFDGIRLYASDLSKSSNIDFYYKNAESDSYTSLTTYSGASYYYTTISGASAPQFVRVTVSGVAIELYEFLIYNDDYVVAFGEDGQTYVEYLDNTPVGEEGDPQAIAIYNNGTGAFPATGYTTIDYTGTDADNYVKISASENGIYKGLADCVLLKDNSGASTYTWDMGEYTDNTTVENNKLTLVDTSTSSQDKLCDLPLTDGSESLNVGSSAMTYDSVNDVIYALGCEASPTILKLYKYDIPTNDWTYLWEVNPGITGYENNAGICYLNGYVYIMCDISTYTFGRYNMVTMSGVWEPLTTASGLSTSTSCAFSMDTDGNNYIYLAAADGVGTNGLTYFQRYDTISGTWTVLDNGFGMYGYSAGTGNSTMSIAYDTDRDYVYSIAGENNGTYEYVSRYDVATDTWNKDYLNRATLGGNHLSSCIAYYEDYIFLYDANSTPTAYLYNIPGDSSRSVSVGSPTIHAHARATNQADFKTFMNVINPRKGNDTMSIIFGCVSGYEDELYGYNMTPVYDRNGTYTSPIFKMDDAYSSSYFIVDATTTSGFTSVSYDDGSYNGTIRVKSSNTLPLSVNEVFWYVGIGAYLEVYKYNLYNFAGGSWKTTTDSSSNLKAFGTAADRRTGHVATSYSRNLPSGKGDFSRSEVIIYDRSATELYSKYLYVSNNNPPYERYGFNTNMEFDKFGGVWGYGDGRTMYLIHFDYQLVSELASIYTGSDFLYDFAVELDGDGIWYTDKSLNIVYHVNTNGSVLQQVVLQSPRAICGTNDNGCWVIDNTDFYARRYAFNGNLVKSVYLSRSATRMCTDYNDGFWYYNSGTSNLYHLNSVGTVLSTTNVANVSRLKSLDSGCMAWSSSNDFVKYINGDGTIVHTFNGPSSTTAYPGAFSCSYTHNRDLKLNIVPASYDPVWGTGGSAEWKEVRKDGYFLPKELYHQAELTLRTTDSVYTPYVNKLLMAPAVKIEDIPSKDYKNMYIKTDIPTGADITDHETKLKTWWKIEE